MVHRIQEYELIGSLGQRYRPRAYGDPQPDGTWDGWLVFFPVAGGSAISPSSRETTQSTFAALAVWAAGLTPVYLGGALARALRHAQQPHLIGRLADAEYQALEDAERLETAAEVERTAADLDEAAAEAARADAVRIRRERLATEGALAATEELAAKLQASAHQLAARDARAIAADAARRRRSAEARPTSRSHSKRGGGKRKRATRSE